MLHFSFLSFFVSRLRSHQNRLGQIMPPMYTEVLPGGQTLALIIPSLTETMAGKYYCSASYASTKQLEMSVEIETYGKCRPRNAWKLNKRRNIKIGAFK